MRKADYWAVIVLLVSVLVFFLPALAGWRGIFQDDVAMDVFPWQYYLARHFQDGVVPLWDANTWSGAKPFYGRFYADTYYPPLWPFLLLGRLDDLDLAYRTISLIPLLLHYLLAVFGMYALARRGLRLRPFPAFVAAWVYLFSPAFSYSYVWPPVVNVQAWTPWFLLIAILMDRGVGFGRIAAGGIVFALMIMAAQPPHVGYAALLAGLLALGLGLRRLKGKCKLRFFRAPLQLAGAALLGLALSAVFWVSALDGSAHTDLHLEDTYEAMTGGDGSMPPVYLATLFIPDLFGTVSGYGNRNWVESVTHGVRFWDANMSGGLLLFFLVLAGVFLVVRRSGLRRLRFWAVFAVLLWIFSVLMMLGRHAPFYHWFYRTVPVLPIFPFPIRYRFLQVIAAAWLAGLGTEYLLREDRSASRWPGRLVWGYIALGGLAGALALFGAAGLKSLLRGEIAPGGWAEIIRRSNLQWFISSPVLYFFAAGLLLVLVWRGLGGRARTAAAVGLAGLEAAVFALAAFYFCIFRFYQPQPQQFRCSGPSAHPMIQRVLGPLAESREDPLLRWTTDQPFHENFAYFQESFAFMGYDMKPLERRFKGAFEEAYRRPVDWPIYWDFPRPVHHQFLSNMSVGYLLDSRPRRLFPEGEITKLEASPDFYLHRNPRALPRAFVLDRVVACSEEEALEESVRGDLRRGVFVEDSDRLSVIGNQSADGQGETDYRLPITDYRSFDPGTEEEYLSQFDDLQKANPITRLDFSNPNRVELDLSVTQPVMLVLTEVWYPGWEARVDGEPAEVIRVNYFQRGVPLEAGRRQVELVFRPRAWKVGAIVSAVSWGAVIVALLVLAVGWVFSRRRRPVSAPRG